MSIKEWVQIQNKLLWWELTGESWIPRNVKNSDGFKTDTTATTAEHVMSNERRHCTNCGISLIDGSFSITKKETKIRLCSKCFHIYCMEGE